MNIPLVYEDEWLVVVDKPAGLLSVPAPGKSSRTLTSILNDDLGSRGVGWRLHPCHRLDLATSGLMVYAKGKAIQQRMMEEFKQRRVAKTYVAFVHGHLPHDAGTIRYPIEGKSALTSYRVTHRLSDFSVIEAHPATGRTNQLRIHFMRLGHPIVGEDKFAFRRDFRLRAKRLCLHARDLEFSHPVTKKLVRLHAALPENLQQFLDDHQQ